MVFLAQHHRGFNPDFKDLINDQNGKKYNQRFG